MHIQAIRLVCCISASSLHNSMLRRSIVRRPLRPRWRWRRCGCLPVEQFECRFFLPHSHYRTMDLCCCCCCCCRQAFKKLRHCMGDAPKSTNMSYKQCSPAAQKVGNDASIKSNDCKISASASALVASSSEEDCGNDVVRIWRTVTTGGLLGSSFSLSASSSSHHDLDGTVVVAATAWVRNKTSERKTNLLPP